jgi:hypothetical protein
MECYVRVDATNVQEKYRDAHRRIVSREIKRVLGSKNVVAGEAFHDGAGGHFHLRVSSPEEIFKLLGRVLTGTCKLESHPLSAA